MKKEEKAKKFDISIISIIAVNLIPFFGILFFQWSLFSVLILYWCESAVIGFFTIAKMIMAKETNVFLNKQGEEIKINTSFNWLIKIFLIPFFCIHFGGFMFGHLFFIFFISIINNPIGIINFDPAVILDTVINILIALVALFISHGISFFKNFIGNGEYKKLSATKLMISPYKRIIVMHVTILLGGFLIMFTGIPHMMLILFIVLKTIVDLRAHKKEHQEVYKIE